MIGFEGFTLEMTFEHVDLEVVAVMVGESVVDLSLDFDRHIIRGEN